MDCKWIQRWISSIVVPPFIKLSITIVAIHDGLVKCQFYAVPPQGVTVIGSHIRSS